MPAGPHSRWLAVGILAALGVTPLTHAAQVLDVEDGVAVEALISLHAPTRVRIDGTTIRDVFGNLQSSACGGGASPVAAATPQVPTVTDAEVLVECDLDKGEIYLRPIAPTDEPINLFVSSPQATYTLLLRPSDRPAGTIVLRDRTRPTAGRDGGLPRGPSANPIRRLKAMLVAMASGEVPPDIHAETVAREIHLWDRVQFTLERRFEGRGLIGEHYALRNLGDDVVVLAEQAFDRESGGVAGVAIEHHHLAPGERTQVYVLRFEEGQ